MTAPDATIDDRQFDGEDQPLFMVMGGEVRDPRGAEFVNLAAIDVRGIYPSYDAAFNVWRGAAQATVDRAFIKYMIIRLR
ncbi:MAG: DUF4170 domain-containing protein [Alphaproteobacteria bacterium]|nr:DUF4170 domain-containing protein [Alphaproteobacteria bacterium]